MQIRTRITSDFKLGFVYVCQDDGEEGRVADLTMLNTTMTD